MQPDEQGTTDRQPDQQPVEYAQPGEQQGQVGSNDQPDERAENPELYEEMKARGLR